MYAYLFVANNKVVVAKNHWIKDAKLQLILEQNIDHLCLEPSEIKYVQNERDMKVSELESVIKRKVSELQGVLILKCYNWKVSNRKVSELEGVRIG